MNYFTNMFIMYLFMFKINILQKTLIKKKAVRLLTDIKFIFNYFSAILLI